MVRFSIIIPTYNRPASLRDCLLHLSQLEYPLDQVETLVVDDGSEACYQSVREEFPNVVWIKIPNGGPAVARNYAAHQARGLYLAFTDDDCYVDPDWLNQLEKTLSENPSALVGGSTPPFREAGVFDQVCQFINSVVYAHYNQVPCQSQFFASNNLAVSRKVFFELGGFDTTHTKNAAEDRTLCNHALDAGFNLIWNKEALVYHHPRLSFRRFCRMYFRYGRGAYTFQKSRRTGSMLVESRFHLQLPRIVLEQLKETPSLPRVPTILLLIVWQLCNLFGFFWQLLKDEDF